MPYRIIFIFAIFVGSIGRIGVVWLLSDIMNGLMALPNLIGLLFLSGIIVAETRSYFERIAHRVEKGA
jgi:AGCS family alanine or glycine:cation symporter